jgi:hypothetical protein
MLLDRASSLSAGRGLSTSPRNEAETGNIPNLEAVYLPLEVSDLSFNRRPRMFLANQGMFQPTCRMLPALFDTAR